MHREETMRDKGSWEVLESIPLSSIISEKERTLPYGNIKTRCGDIHTTIDRDTLDIHSTMRLPGNKTDHF